MAARASDTLRAILGKAPAPFALPRELIGTDRVLQRWAGSSGTGLPMEDYDEEPKSKPPPLPDDVAIIVDEIIVKSPPKTKELITRWYKSPDPVESIGRRLGISPRSVYRAHAASLYYIRDRFETSRDPTLCRLVRAVES